MTTTAWKPLSLIACAFAAVALLVFSSTPAFAQGLNYVDESGNIYFVESVSQVPVRYRSQFLKPTPVPVDKRGRPIVAQKSPEQIAKEREKKRLEKVQERELNRQKRKFEREQARIQRESDRKFGLKGAPLASDPRFNRKKQSNLPFGSSTWSKVMGDGEATVDQAPSVDTNLAPPNLAPPNLAPLPVMPQVAPAQADY